MAKPYFTGDYGAHLARVDTRPIIEAGRAQGQMYANLGAQVGGMIQQYGLNKEKRAKLTGEVEALYKEHPELLVQIGMSGDEAQDKKDITERERFVKGDMNMAQLEGYAGKLARGEVLRSKKLQDESRVIQNEMGRHTLGLAQELKDTTIKLEKNKGLTSDIQLTLAKWNKEDWGQLKDPALKEKLMQLRDAAGARAAYPLSKQKSDDRKLSGLRIGAAEREAKTFEAMGGVPGQVKRLEEDRKLQKLQALGLYHARTNIGQSSPATVPIQKILSETQKELDRIGSLKTTLTDDDDKSLSVIDLLEVKPNREIGLKEGYDLTTMDDVTRDNVQLFLTQSGKVQDAQRQMPVELKRIFDLTEFGDQLVEVGREVEMGDGRTGRVVSIENGKVNVIYEGTLYEKNLQDTEALQRAEAARVDVPRFSPSEHVQDNYGM